MTAILFAGSPSVFSWSRLGRESSAAFLLSRPEQQCCLISKCFIVKLHKNVSQK